MSPGVVNLFEILNACGKSERRLPLLRDYHAGKLQYRELKEVVANALVKLTSGLRAQREEIRKDAESVKVKVKEMSKKRVV